MPTVHYKPLGWASTACRRPAREVEGLVYTFDPNQVDCKNCLGFMTNAIGIAGLQADAIRELTAITLDVATKKDIAALRAEIEEALRLVLDTARNVTPRRYMTVEDCAVYIGRTPGSVRSMVSRAAIPHIMLGTRVQFDKERIDKWMEKNRRNAAGDLAWRRRSTKDILGR